MSMVTGLITHLACLGHLPPSGHPESADRLRAVLRALEPPSFQDLIRLEAPAAGQADIERVHTKAHVETILGRLAQDARAEGYARIDADTVMSEGSAEAALRAAGAGIMAVDEIHAGRLRNAFCAVRPPGHHAERRRAMGFCLFNNAAIAASHARLLGYRRVAVIDFDVHHGNGTQDIFYADEAAFYGSTHQYPFYPGTGARSERGIAGNVVNVPLHAGAGATAFRAAYESEILPALDKFRPDFVFISAGFDGHRADPLAELTLDETDYAWVTTGICAVAAGACGGRVVSLLEGGYDLAALAHSAAAHVRALMEA